MRTGYKAARSEEQVVIPPEDIDHNPNLPISRHVQRGIRVHILNLKEYNGSSILSLLSLTMTCLVACLPACRFAAYYQVRQGLKKYLMCKPAIPIKRLITAAPAAPAAAAATSTTNKAAIATIMIITTITSS
uniref:Uncharacterized protein n=1 Tax=Glossina palpalis gambiensis TaxID=67801 RepID=A0A1B0BWU9_9MUSC